MRVASRLLVLGALTIGALLPSAASARSPVVVHLYLSGKQTTTTTTGFTSTSNVSFGNNLHHGAVAGTATLTCTNVTASSALCSATIAVVEPGSGAPRGSVSFFDTVVDFSAPPVFHIDFDTGIWGGTNGGFFSVERVSDRSSNVTLDLIY